MKELFLPEAQNSFLWVMIGSPWFWLACYLFIINLVAFFMMGNDKRKSKKEGKRRIPEKNFFFTALLGGSIGAILGMRTFRHKTRHWYFVWGMPAILILQIALKVFLIWYF